MHNITLKEIKEINPVAIKILNNSEIVTVDLSVLPTTPKWDKLMKMMSEFGEVK